METTNLPIYNLDGKEVDTIKLDAHVFDGIVNKDAIHQAIIAYRANQRKGLAQTKTRGEVSGGGKKPWKQKGTGRARHGSTRSPLWKHGGVTFGPHPRDFSYNLPEKIKRLALKSALCSKLNESNLMVLEDAVIAKAKTKNAVKAFSNLKIERKKKVLLLDHEFNKNSRLAFRNISFLTINLAKDTFAYEVLNCKKLLVTKEGIKVLTQRLK